MKRRKFLHQATALGLLGTGALSACGGQQSSNAACEPGQAGKKLKWKMVTTWPRDFPGLGTGANTLANYITRMSNGRLEVKVYGGNELVPPFEAFDAVSRGTAEMGHGAPYYWKGKVPAAQFFAGVPFGLTAQEHNAWLYYGGGMELWREAYEPFGLIPFAVGNSSGQMGGWFNKQINSLDDLQGLKMRIPGLGGEVIRRAGGTPLNIPGAELFTALQTGSIDATEWVGPYNDLAFGLFRAADYYYYPGWHEPGTGLEAFVNKEAFEALPEDLQTIVEVACQAANMDMLSEFMARNGDALLRLQNQHQVTTREFPEEVLQRLKTLTTEVLEELAAEDPMSGKVYESYKSFYDQVQQWSAISEQANLDVR